LSELERRREMAKKEIRLLYQQQTKQTSSKVIDQSFKVVGLYQLRILKRDLQLLYKDLVMGAEVEKGLNDLILNVNDCIQDVEIELS
jgi:hypothetical protein